MLALGVERGGPAEHIRRSIPGIIMQERAATAERILELVQMRRLPGITWTP